MQTDSHPAPRALVVRAAGTNCDAEMVRALTLAGARVALVHIDRLAAEPALLESAELIGFPGGFSYGDDVASGRILALRVRLSLGGALRDAVARGACVIGACNGFQVLVQTGLLPGLEGSDARVAALADNEQGRFVDHWVPVRVEPGSPCVWTAGLERAHPEALRLPIAHGEGRFVCGQATLSALEAAGQVALRYGEPTNGSANDIAGVCDPTGRVLGLMPHPERYLQWNRHPYWTRLNPQSRRGPTPGLAMFQNAVRAVTALAGSH
jgi:phosphoribosylformylglycinamidine synthase